MTTPDTEVGARLSLRNRPQFVEDAHAASTAVKEVGTSTEEAGTKAEASGTRFQTFAAKAKMSGGVLGRVGGQVKGLAVGFAAFFALDKAKDVLQESVGMANDLAKAQKGTAAALKSTGHSSKETMKSINEQSEALSKLSGQSVITTHGLENMLLTFPKIKGDNFKKAGVEAANLSARLGTSLPSAARMLGRALNDPTLGLTGLSRVGIRFTDTQKAMITNMVNTGHAAKAQAYILSQVQNRVGGAAAAAVTPTERLHLAWENFEMKLGQKVLPRLNQLRNWMATKGLPDVLKLASAVRDHLGPYFTKFGDWLNKTGIPAIKGVAKWVEKNKSAVEEAAKYVLIFWAATKAWTIVMLGAAKAMKVLAIIQAVLNGEMDANPIGIVVIALAALTAGLIYAYKHSATFRAIVQDTMHGVAVAIDFVKNHWQLFVIAFLLPFAPMIFGIKELVQHFGTVENFIMGLYHWIAGHWKLLLAILTGPFILGPIEIIKHLHTIINFIESMPDKIANKAVGMFDGIKEAFKASINWIISGWNNLSFTLPKVNTHIPGVGTLGGWTLGTPNIPLLAGGGNVAANRPYYVGEAGKEMFIPNVNGRVIPNSRIGSDRILGGDSPTVIPRSTVPQQAGVGIVTSHLMDEGNGVPVILQVVLDRKVLAEASYTVTRDKAARQ